jgi:probable HAF family extracellular repeat protein
MDRTGDGMIDLGTLGGRESFAFGINDAGQVVGWSHTSTTAGTQHAFIIGSNGVGMADLNSLVSQSGGVVLTEAQGINNLGQVAAIASPIPEPGSYAPMLAGLILTGVMLRRKKTESLI